MTRVVLALADRSLRLQVRRAQFLVPTVLLPLLLLAVIASGTSAGQDLRGFPDVQSYLAFLVPGTVVQGTLLAGLTGGVAMAGDIEGGFFDRLRAAPVPRVALVLGRLLGTVGVVGAQATLFVLVGLLFGARYGGGVPGVLAGIGIAMVCGIGTAGVATAIALWTGSLSLLQNLFPFMFVLLFTSPAFFPQDLLAPVLRDVSAYNPLSYVVEGVRGALSGDASLGDPWLGLAAAAGIALVMTLVATAALGRRLKSA